MEYPGFDLVDFIVIASNFSNLRRLEVCNNALDKLASRPKPSEPSNFLLWLKSSDEAAVALRIVLSRVWTLKLSMVWSCDWVAALLSVVGRQLHSLTLRHCPDGENQDGRHLLFDRLRGLNLRHLDVDMQFLVGFEERLDRPIWPLESLTLRTSIELQQAAVDFMSLFAPTLTRLEILSGEDEEDEIEEPVRILSSPCPFLQYLSISGATNAFLLTPPSFMPALRRLSIRSQAEMVPEMANHLEARLTSLPTLQSVELGINFYDLPYLPYKLSKTVDHALARIPLVVNRAKFNPIILSSEEVLNQNSLISDSDDSAPRFIRRRRQLVRQVLNFALNLEERIARTDDKRGMERLIECIRPLAMLKDFEED